jgi:trehalose synthase
MATDDPEGPVIFAEVTKRVAEMEDVTLITQTDPLLVNALQRCASVVLQMSVREGFGLTVSEALWKGTPVVATEVGGIPLQIRDGETGFLVAARDYDRAAERIVTLLQDPPLAEELGSCGRELVRKEFLIPRLLLDWLRILRDLAY